MQIVGAIHGHSLYSDGLGTVAEIRDAAADAGLDFLILTDHDTLGPLAEVGEGFHRQTLSLFGCEVSPPTNHLLVLGATRCPDRTLTPQEYLDEASAQGALTFLAHPHDRGVPLAHLPAYAWDAWPIEGYTGIELWNQLSDWSGHVGGLGSAMRALLRPSAHLHGPEAETLRLWDEVGRSRPVTGIAGLDVHDVQIGRRPFLVHVFRYAYAMRTLLCYVDVADWSQDAERSKSWLLEALAKGRLHFANRELADARGLSFAAVRRGGPPARMGEEVLAGEVVELGLASPERAELSILRDGKPMAETFGTELSLPAAGPGVYRAELRLRLGRRSLPWAFTNPIYLR